MIKNILFLATILLVFSNTTYALNSKDDPALKAGSEGPGIIAADEEAPKVANCEVCKSDKTPIHGRHPALRTGPAGSSEKSTEATGTK